MDTTVPVMMRVVEGVSMRPLEELGCAKINLQIRREHADAVAFYQALGFVEDDVISLGKRLIDDTPGAT